MNTEEIKKSFVKAKQFNEVVFLQNAFPVTPFWDEFIYNLNYRYNSEKTIDMHDERFHNDVLIYNKLDPISFTKSNLVKNYSYNIFKKTYSVFDFIDKIIPNISCVKSIINFVGNESKYYIHADHHDVISWHCIGKVEWRIFKTLKQDNPPPTESDEPYESYILNPGDILFVPGGLVHQVVVTEPRASVLFNCYM